MSNNNKIGEMSPGELIAVVAVIALVVALIVKLL